MVTSSYSDHVTTVPWLYIHPFVYITMANFSAIFQGQINRSTSQVAHFMFGKIFSACCRYLLHLKYNVFPRMCLVVTSSYSDHVTTAGFSLKKSIFF